jgi:hypothetical protein
MTDRFDAHVLIAELQDICFDSLLNKEQKKRFIESTVLSALLLVQEEDLPALRGAWKMSKW